MKTIRVKYKALFLIIIMISMSCSRQITRVATDSTIEVSGRWNDSDSRFTAEDLSNQIVNANWASDHTIKKGKKPVVIVGLIRNKSHEHIESETFVKDIEKSLLNTQRAKVVQGGKMREELRGERADQQNNASVTTMKKFGLETGADYIIQGNINSIVDAHKRDKVVYYQVDLELIDIQSNEKVWIGDKKIKKFVKN
ncbi:penicillin-binding protein activator LpoB [Aquimarina sp. AD10]|uniref:Penicillin-binding protein activator LpoB n=1 Tax=Aquimarina aggregata TaxID=1642818 RepID=A0A162WM18_9FLAO|nr:MULTISPECIES: penicillin-binding protein activator LpoB [Aquimarina]AXT61519.1 penicillin-binding protein activator LpoB [Aquimarina sp. AD10]KZS38186.1 penicillin-binding protein activator LpoB [Aquimarina aggregata]RKM90003.1 penicillin-binding protein activator LpoB [Aquimarina sp. AD10]